MNKTDFTKRCLADALFALMKEKPYEDISIQDIVDKAGFSRMAYYRNFKSINDILDYYLDSYVMDVYTKSNIPHNPSSASDAFRNFLVILSDERIKEIGTVFDKQELMGRIYKNCRNRIIAHSNSDKMYYSAFVTGGMIEVYINWVKGGYKETPEQLVEILHAQIDDVLRNL